MRHGLIERLEFGFADLDMQVAGFAKMTPGVEALAGDHLVKPLLEQYSQNFRLLRIFKFVRPGDIAVTRGTEKLRDVDVHFQAVIAED